MTTQSPLNTAVSATPSPKDLIAAVKRGDLPDVKVFLEQGVDVNCTDESGYTPLTMAAACDKTEIIDFLVDKGANLEQWGFAGLTPLMWAAYNRKEESVQRLLEKGVNPDARGAYGNTAMIWAMRQGCIEAIPLLISKGASVEAVSDEGGTVIDIAIERKRPDVIEMIKEAVEMRQRFEAHMAAVKAEAVRHMTVSQKQQRLKEHAPKLKLKLKAGP